MHSHTEFILILEILPNFDENFRTLKHDEKPENNL